MRQPSLRLEHPHIIVDGPNNSSAPRAEYDGGDCCEASCVDNDFMCGEREPYDCRDPDYADDGDYPQQSSYSYGFDVSCQEDKMGNGYCNPSNNNEECGKSRGPRRFRLRSTGELKKTVRDNT